MEVDLVDENLEHLPLILEHLDVGVFLLSDLGHDVMGEWLLVEFSQ